MRKWLVLAFACASVFCCAAAMAQTGDKKCSFTILGWTEDGSKCFAHQNCTEGGYHAVYEIDTKAGKTKKLCGSDDSGCPTSASAAKGYGSLAGLTLRSGVNNIDGVRTDIFQTKYDLHFELSTDDGRIPLGEATDAFADSEEKWSLHHSEFSHRGNAVVYVVFIDEAMGEDYFFFYGYAHKPLLAAAPKKKEPVAHTPPPVDIPPPSLDPPEATYWAGQMVAAEADGEFFAAQIIEINGENCYIELADFPGEADWVPCIILHPLD